MKRIILPIICLILAVQLFGQISPVKNNSERTFYYFCVSHSMYSQTNQGKQVILYTSVYQITCEEKKIREKTNQWWKLVETNCENKDGCTSDLNYYQTKEDAEKQFETTKHLYGDTKKYILKMIDFK